MKIDSPNILSELSVSGSAEISGSLNVLGTVTATTFSGLLSSSAQVSYSGLSDIPAGIVSGSSQIQLSGITGTTFGSADFTFPQDLGVSGSIALQRVEEKTTISATAATGTVNFDYLTQSVLYYTTNASGNWTLNIRGDGSTSFDSLVPTGKVVSVVFLVTNGSPAYYQTAITIDGSSVTPKWQGGLAPVAGNADSVDSYVISIIKTAPATFTVLQALTQFK
jgi:hypothetical protein